MSYEYVVIDRDTALDIINKMFGYTHDGNFYGYQQIGPIDKTCERLDSLLAEELVPDVQIVSQEVDWNSLSWSIEV